ncbi:AAA family ATPase [Streptomyces sp. NPDC097941]|uniref:AAA family ATPase n=1 Tax=Streptomyces sp. NPDC097941 TaxID=3155685 RepID=UPI0033198DB5
MDEIRSTGRPLERHSRYGGEVWPMNLVDRTEELSVMESMLGACGAGHGGVLWVSGAVASGKTALLRAFGARATANGALFLQATASEAEKVLPLGVLGQLLLGADLPAVDAERATGLVELVAREAQRHGTPEAPPALAMNVIPELCGTLLKMAEKRPVVISVDAVQHADSQSLDCLLYLARRLDTSRILVVLAGNSGFPDDRQQLKVDLLRLSGVRHIRLRPLRRQGVADLVSTLGQDLRQGRKLVADLYRVGGGNPLLTQALIEDQRTSDAAALVPGDAFAQAVTATVYRSDTSVRHTVWGLAVLGSHRSLAELVEVLGTTQEAVQRGLCALNEAGLLDNGRFRHEAGRTAALRSMEPAHRAHLEARAAQVLHEHGAAATVVVRHLVAAEPVDAPWALRTLLDAAQRALADDEIEFALTCLRTARDSGADAGQLLAVKAELTRAGWRVNPSAAAQNLPELTAAALGGRLGARHVDELVGQLLWFGKVDEALDVVGSAEKHGGPSGPDGTKGAGLDSTRRWIACVYPGRPGSVATRHADAAATDDLARGLRQRTANLIETVLEGAEDAVVVRAEQILQSTRLDDSTLTALVVAVRSLVLADRLDTAALWCDTLLQEATERRVPMWQALLSSAKARMDLRAGRLAAAEESARVALTLVPAEGWGVAVVSPVTTSLHVNTALGRLDEAAAQLAVPIPDPAFQTTDGLLYLQARGHYYLVAGRPYAALDDFLTCGDLMTRWNLDLPALVPWRTDAAQAYLSLGDDERALNLAEEQLALAGPGRSWVHAVSLRVMASGLTPRQRLPLIDEAVEILRERGHRFELARAIADLAQTHRELGDGGRARALARKAQQLERECGVPAPRTRPAAETGSPTDERPWNAHGNRGAPVELTDGELRVATLAADGYTNRQIAEKLFITISTVEQHLTRSYRKLAVRRRADLAARLSSVSVPCGGEEDVHGGVCGRLRAV